MLILNNLELSIEQCLRDIETKCLALKTANSVMESFSEESGLSGQSYELIVSSLELFNDIALTEEFPSVEVMRGDIDSPTRESLTSLTMESIKRYAQKAKQGLRMLIQKLYDMIKEWLTGIDRNTSALERRIDELRAVAKTIKGMKQPDAKFLVTSRFDALKDDQGYVFNLEERLDKLSKELGLTTRAVSEANEVVMKELLDLNLSPVEQEVIDDLIALSKGIYDSFVTRTRSYKGRKGPDGAEAVSDTLIGDVQVRAVFRPNVPSNLDLIPTIAAVRSQIRGGVRFNRVSDGNEINVKYEYDVDPTDYLVKVADAALDLIHGTVKANKTLAKSNAYRANLLKQSESLVKEAEALDVPGLDTLVADLIRFVNSTLSAPLVQLQQHAIKVLHGVERYLNTQLYLYYGDAKVRKDADAMARFDDATVGTHLLIRREVKEVSRILRKIEKNRIIHYLVEEW